MSLLGFVVGRGLTGRGLPPGRGLFGVESPPNAPPGRGLELLLTVGVTSAVAKKPRVAFGVATLVVDPGA